MFISILNNTSNPKYSRQKSQMATKPYSYDNFQQNSAKIAFKSKNPFENFSEGQIEWLTGLIDKLDNDDGKGALSLLKRIMGIHPDNHFLHQIKGVVYNELGHTEEAIQAFTTSIELNPKTPDSMEDLAHSLHARGHLHMKTDNLEEAVDDFAHCLKIEPEGFKPLSL